MRVGAAVAAEVGLRGEGTDDATMVAATPEGDGGYPPPPRRFRCRPPRIIIARCSITGCPRCRHLRRAFAPPAEFNGGSGGGGRRTVMARMAHCANIHSGFVLLQARVRGARARKIVHVRAEILSRMMQYAKLPEEHWSGEDCTTNQYHRHELNITLTCMLHLFCSKQEFVVCKKYII